MLLRVQYPEAWALSSLSFTDEEKNSMDGENTVRPQPADIVTDLDHPGRRERRMGRGHRHPSWQAAR
jgi:hypothetical protein